MWPDLDIAGLACNCLFPLVASSFDIRSPIHRLAYTGHLVSILVGIACLILDSNTNQSDMLTHSECRKIEWHITARFQHFRGLSVVLISLNDPRFNLFLPLKHTTMCNTYILFPPSFTVPSVCSIVRLQCLILVNGLCILLSDVCHICKTRVRMFVKRNKEFFLKLSFPFFCPCGLPKFYCVSLHHVSCVSYVCFCAPGVQNMCECVRV